jgi:hypothetical protein
MLGMLRMITANNKRVLRMQVIVSEVIFAIAKVKVTKGTCARRACGRASGRADTGTAGTVVMLLGRRW